MSGQELFQIVSTGKTLRGIPAEEVIQAASRLFKIPAPQAQRLMLKGWVIKDRLTRANVVDYQTRLHKLGLKIAVCPAGKFDNRALVARIQAASQRRNRHKGERSPVTEAASSAQPSSPAVPGNNSGGRSEGERRALEELGALFSSDDRLRQPATDWVTLLPGAVGAAIVPGIFVFAAVALSLAGVGALWQIPESLIAGDFSLSTVTGALASLAMVAVVALFTVVPFILAEPRLDETSPAEQRPLHRKDAPQLFLLLEALSERVGLPMVEKVRVTRGAEVIAGAGLSGAWRQRLVLTLGFSAVRAYSGAELLGLLSRALGFYAGRGWALITWMVLGSAGRLQAMQVAFEDGRVFPVSESASALQGINRVLGYGARPLAPLIDRLLALHQRLGNQAARLLQRRADRWCAAMLGSEGFAPFSDKWQQVVHSALIAAEANREAAIVDQRLEDFPTAVVWLREHLDDETRGNLELAMTHTSDPWDPAAPADIDRIGEVESSAIAPMLRGNFSSEKLFPDLSEISREVSGLGDVGSASVGHLQLLAASREAEESLVVLQEYFNRVVPARIMPLEIPQSDELAGMDLQGCIDWLRGKLVELREYQGRLSELENRGALMQLGRLLLKAQVPVEAGDYQLCGATVSAADESVSDNRARRNDLEQQIRGIHALFALRIERARQQMSTREAEAVSQRLEMVRELGSLAPRLASMEMQTKILDLVLERLDSKREMRVVIERLADLVRGEWQALQTEIRRGRHMSAGDLTARLEKRVGHVGHAAFPEDRAGQEALLRQLQAQLKAASAVTLEYYRVQLAGILSPCLAVERSNKVRPLRLVAVSA